MISRCILTTLLVLFATFCASPAAPALHQAWDDIQSLDDGWNYIESDAATPPSDLASAAIVKLPHTWNDKDTLEMRNYRRDVSWYIRTLNITPDFIAANKQLYLRCAAAGQTAEMFLNNVRLGNHNGGYSAFTFQLTPQLLAGRNTIAIRVSNQYTRSFPPISGDFNQYGGLYRGVTLITAPKTSFSRDEFSGPGVRVWSPVVSKDQATTCIETALSNSSNNPVEATIIAELYNNNGEIVSRAQTAVVIVTGKKTIASITLPAVENPRLWSPESPNLYSLKLTLMQDEKQLDTVRVHHGFRWFLHTPDKGFFLNGEPYRLIGTNLHQDHQGFGNALSLELIERDLQSMKEIGVNYLRPAHYQQNDYLLQRCDELGILVAEEVPYVNETGKGPEFEENLRLMMREMITQHFNHPSIIVWGMGNEVGMKDRGDGKADCYDLIFRLNALVHELDPIRKTIFVSANVDAPSKLGVMNIPDLVGYNLYQGWYGTDIYEFKKRATEFHQMNPNKPLIVTEFGAGSDLRVHSSNPVRFDFSEEYQVTYLDGYIDQFEEMPWLNGFNYWAFADFGSSYRGNTIHHINQKGLVTFDRQPKDAFYLWKSRFTENPVLRIQSSAWTKRYGPLETTIRVITNLNQVELIHNGKSIGAQTNKFNWPIKMTQGTNAIIAKGKDSNGNPLEHQTTFTYVGKIKYLDATASTTSTQPVSHLVDLDVSTQWSAPPNGWAEVDLDTPKMINSIEIEPYQGETTRYHLSVSGKAKAKEEWTLLWSGETVKGQKFLIPQAKQLDWGYIRIDALDSPIAINELHITTTTERRKKSLYEKIGAGELNKK